MIPKTDLTDAAWPKLARALGHASLVRFLAVGSAGLMTDTLAFSALSGMGSADAVARAGSLAVATLVTWRLNRRFTFAATGRAPGLEAARYVTVAICAQGLNYGLFLALRAALPAWPALVALFVSAGTAALVSFLGQRTVTFAPVAQPTDFGAPKPAFRSGR